MSSGPLFTPPGLSSGMPSFFRAGVPWLMLARQTPSHYSFSKTSQDLFGVINSQYRKV